MTGIVWLDLTDEELKQIQEIELAKNFRRQEVVPAVVGETIIQALTYLKK